MRTIDDVIANLPADSRARVTSRAQKLIAEEVALRRVREARSFTQESLARVLGLKQADISKLESRSDLLLSTLRSYVCAMGGKLRVVAEFPDGCTELSTLGEAIKESAREPRKKKQPTQTKRRRPELVHDNHA
jgi:transcriptional regulator with XRE-family HTH domain